MKAVIRLIENNPQNLIHLQQRILGYGLYMDLPTIEDFTHWAMEVKDTPLLGGTGIPYERLWDLLEQYENVMNNLNGELGAWVK